MRHLQVERVGYKNYRLVEISDPVSGEIIVVSGTRKEDRERKRERERERERERVWGWPLNLIHRKGVGGYHSVKSRQTGFQIILESMSSDWPDHLIQKQNIKWKFPSISSDL